jgi:hypothetical protein
VVLSSVGDVPVGYYATYNVIIKPRQGDVTPLQVNASATTAGLSICSLKIVEVSQQKIAV